MFKTMVAMLLAVAFTSQAQFLTSRFTTSFYGWQGIDSARAKTFYARAYEQVQLNVAGEHYQFNTNFQASNDFGTTIAADPELRISSLMVKGKNIGGLTEISVGRQFVYAGVGAGIIDGGLISAKFFDDMIGITAYSGLNVIRTRDWNLNQSLAENSLSGALLTVAPIENGTIGVSFMNKYWKRSKFNVVRADSLFNPQTVVVYSNPNEEQYASMDLSYELHSSLSLYARSDYDVNTEEISRTQFSAKYNLTKELNIGAEYLFRQPRVAFNSIFSVFDFSSTKEIEGSVEYQLLPQSRIYARFANVKYSYESSQRLSIGGMYEFLSFNYSQNFGYAGELSGINVYAAYPLMENTLTPTVGFGYATYKNAKENPNNTVMNFLLGANYRIMKNLSSDVQFQWMKNPQFNTDSRVFVRVSYFLSDNLNLL